MPARSDAPAGLGRSAAFRGGGHLDTALRTGACTLLFGLADPTCHIERIEQIKRPSAPWKRPSLSSSPPEFATAPRRLGMRDLTTILPEGRYIRVPVSRLPVLLKQLARRSGRILAPCRRGWPPCRRAAEPTATDEYPSSGGRGVHGNGSQRDARGEGLWRSEDIRCGGRPARGASRFADGLKRPSRDPDRIPERTSRICAVETPAHRKSHGT